MGSLGTKIKELRKRRRMTQQSLADGLVTPSMISQIESDRATPSAKLLEELAARLGVNVTYFQDDVEHKTDQAQTYRKAKTLLEIEQYEAALELLETLTLPLPSQFREETFCGELATCYQRLGRNDEAADMYERMVQIALEKEDVASAVHALHNVALMYRKAAELSLAKMYWVRASLLLAHHPDLKMPISFKIHSNLGRACLTLQDYEMAVDSYLKAIELGKIYVSSVDQATNEHGLANAYLGLGNWDAAFRHMEEAAKRYNSLNHTRGVYQCRINLAIILKNQGDYVAAAKSLRALLEDVRDDAPRLANACYEYAECLYHMAQYDAALEILSQIQGHDKHLLEAIQKLRVDIYMAANRFDDALDSIRRSVTDEKGCDPTVFWTLLRTEAELYRNRRAYTELKHVLLREASVVL